MTTFTLTRQQLYDLVWSEPMRNLATKIGISDVAVAKHCRKADIPVPERGYWNKLQAGHKVVQTALAPYDLGTINLVRMSGTLTPELRARIKGEPGELGADTESIDVLAERFRKRLGTVPAPRNLNTAHPAIAALLRKDEQLRQKHAGSPLYSWYQPRFDSPFERRRLRALNGLFLGVAKVGGEGWTRGDTARELGLRIGDASISFELDHQAAKRGRTVPPPEDKKAKLHLTIAYERMPAGLTYRWEDKDDLPLEDQLADVIVGLVTAAEHLRRLWLEQQRAWQREEQERKERAEKERREAEERQERERLAALEQAKVDALRDEAENWRRAGDIRKYVASLTAAAPEDQKLRLWAEWALIEADKLDPIASGTALAKFAALRDSPDGDDPDSHSPDREPASNIATGAD